MSHKINPYSLRLGIRESWKSRWFPKKNSKWTLAEDVLIRKFIDKKIGSAGLSRIDIERVGNRCLISVKAARPGLIIGRGGKGIEELKSLLEKEITSFRKKSGVTEAVNIGINVEEVKRLDVSAQVTATNIAWDIEKRFPFRRVIKKTLETVMQNKSVLGAKIMIAGRLNGAEIARSERLSAGTLPLQTLRANVDYGEATAFTTYGTIGVKVWINKKGDI